MDQGLLKHLLSCLSKYAFQQFVGQLLIDGYGESKIQASPEFGEGVYRRQLSGQSDTYTNEPGLASHIDGLYLSHFLPYEYLTDPRKADVRDPELIQSLRVIHAAYESEPRVANWLGKRVPSYGFYFLNNFSGLAQSNYLEVIHAKYRSLMDELQVWSPVIALGNYDSFVEQAPLSTERAFHSFLRVYKEGLCISLSDRVSINNFSSDKPLFSGVSRESLSPYEPLFTFKQSEHEGVLQEFEALLNREPSEAEIEGFLVSHYKDIFGPKYDRIETQLWLRIPDLDIVGKNRRLDMFLRNTVTSDWELFEVKRPIRLTTTYRDMPVICKEVSFALHQVKNYARVLSNDLVKRKFAAEGIEYYEPAFHLIVGRKPQIALSQWRQLLVDVDRDVKVITYDDLLNETRARFNDRYRFSGLGNKEVS